MIEYFGALSVFLFIAASALQAIKSVRQGNSHGISHGAIWTLLTGLTGMTAYVLKHGADPLLLISYLGQLVSWIVIAVYRYFPRR